jgi:hypothetical protein
MRKIAVVAAYIVAGILGIGLISVAAFFMYEGHVERVKQAWEWNHYTGYRLIARDDTAHGIFLDKRTNKECSTLGYPGYAACPPQEQVVDGETFEQICRNWEDKHPIGSPVDRLHGQWDNGEKMPPEGVILGVPNGCKGPLETAYEEKIPKIDFDALAKRNGGVVITPDQPTMWVAVDPIQQFGGTFVHPPSLPRTLLHSCEPGSRVWHDKVQWICVRDTVRSERLPDDSVLGPSKILDVQGGDTLRFVPTPDMPKTYSDFVPLVYLARGQKFWFACELGSNAQASSPAIDGTTLSCPSK